MILSTNTTSINTANNTKHTSQKELAINDPNNEGITHRPHKTVS